MAKRNTKNSIYEEKGISPIVSVVLLIAIAVIAAVSIYFWAGGLVTKQPTTKAPIPIVATPLGGGKVLIANLGQKDVNASTLKTSNEGLTINCSDAVIHPGEQTLCTINGTTSSGVVTVYGGGTGSSTLTLTPKLIDQPPSIVWVHDNSTDGYILLGETLHVRSKITDDHGVNKTLLYYNAGSGWSNASMADEGSSVYSLSETPTQAGDLQYYVWANDTIGQASQSSTNTVDVIQNWFYKYGNGTINDIVETSDGYLLVGDNGTAGLVMRIYSNGTVKWAKQYDSGTTNHLYAGIRDGNKFLLGGETDNDAWLFNVDSDGNIDAETNETIDFGGNDSIYDIARLSDGTVVIGGKANDTAMVASLTIVRTIPVYDIDTLKVLNDTSSNSEIDSIYPTSDGGLIVAGSMDGLIAAKFDSSLNPVWTKKIVYNHAKIGNVVSYGKSAVEHNNHYYFTGYEWHDRDNMDHYPFIVKTDESGTVLANITYDDGNMSAASSVNGIILALNNGNLTLGKANGNLDVEWMKQYDNDSQTLTMQSTQDNGILISGTEGDNIMMIKTGPSGGLSDCNEENINISQSSTSASFAKDSSYTFIDGTTNNISGVDVNSKSVSPSLTCVCKPFGC